jgi:hypothetical protein
MKKPVTTAINPPNPGSDEAIAAGCHCPVMDNRRGRGYMGQPNMFVYTARCPVHDPANAFTTTTTIVK